jgi:hypothetical protein
MQQQNATTKDATKRNFVCDGSINQIISFFVEERNSTKKKKKEQQTSVHVRKLGLTFNSLNKAFYYN